MKKYFVTAIGTDSGKTLTSAILVQALQADYWKPIQAGLPRDTETVKNLIDNTKTVFHPEAYLLETPASPHAAAKIDGISIETNKIKAPETSRNLIIEGAGGLMVPLNDKDFIIDLVPLLGAEIILVADLYLGSINHTILAMELLRYRAYPVKGIIFNGDENKESEDIISKYADYPCLLKIRREEKIDSSIVNKYASEFLKNWYHEPLG